MASIEKRGENSWRIVVEIGTTAQGKRLKKTKHSLRKVALPSYEEGKPFYPETPYLHFRNLLLKHKLPKPFRI